VGEESALTYDAVAAQRLGGRGEERWSVPTPLAEQLRGGGRAPLPSVERGGGLTWVDENDDKNKPPKAVRNGWLFG
jgi:hypothetical protein